MKYIQLSIIARAHIQRKNHHYDVILPMGYTGAFLGGTKSGGTKNAKTVVWRASGSPLSIVRREREHMGAGVLSHVAGDVELRVLERLERRCVRNAAMHLFPSTAMKKLFEEAYGFRSKKYFIPCSGVSVCRKEEKQEEKQEEKREEKRESSPLLDWSSLNDTMKILTVGGLAEERKGKLIILRACEQIRASGNRNVKLIVAGGCSDIPSRLSSMIISLGNVPYDRMPELYENCDMLIFPSIHEGFPNVILEAAIHGMPIIASRLVGINEYFKNGREIMLLKENSPENLVRAIDTLMHSPKKRAALSRAVQKRAQTLSYTYFVRAFVNWISSPEAKAVHLLKRRARI